MSLKKYRFGPAGPASSNDIFGLKCCEVSTSFEAELRIAVDTKTLSFKIARLI